MFDWPLLSLVFLLCRVTVVALSCCNKVAPTGGRWRALCHGASAVPRQATLACTRASANTGTGSDEMLCNYSRGTMPHQLRLRSIVKKRTATTPLTLVKTHKKWASLQAHTGCWYFDVCIQAQGLEMCHFSWWGYKERYKRYKRNIKQ